MILGTGVCYPVLVAAGFATCFYLDEASWSAILAGSFAFERCEMGLVENCVLVWFIDCGSLEPKSGVEEFNTCGPNSGSSNFFKLGRNLS